jgi:hypothetical protein
LLCPAVGGALYTFMPAVMALEKSALATEGESKIHYP